MFGPVWYEHHDIYEMMGRCEKIWELNGWLVTRYVPARCHQIVSDLELTRPLSSPIPSYYASWLIGFPNVFLLWVIMIPNKVASIRSNFNQPGYVEWLTLISPSHWPGSWYNHHRADPVSLPTSSCHTPGARCSPGRHGSPAPIASGIP